jgi:predicted ATPase
MDRCGAARRYLARALRVARRTHAHRASGVVLVSGDSGIGKTALLSEITRQAAHMHIRVGRTKCDKIGYTYLGAPILSLLRAGRDPLISAAELEALTKLLDNPWCSSTVRRDILRRWPPRIA